MGDLALKPQWHDNIEQIEKGDLVLGGPNGKANRQAKQLAESLLFFRQQQDALNDQYTLYFDTVADLVVTEGLKDGLVVATKGYYIAGDGGGARYLISSIATDYSIPLSNDLHAIFSDSFDIRKFGIRDNATLDQTTEIQRMVNYADKFVYEIDFLNFSLMTPKISHFFTDRTTLVGMGFRKVHHLKNLTIANNKTEQLVAGTNPILFLPDDLNGSGKFKLSNIKFDPYVSNFALTNNGEADGYMCGFVVQWHKDSNWVYPNSNWVVSKYDIELDDIEFLSPAISYNLACGGIFTRNLIANNVRGDYWGLMLVHHTYNLDANNIHGVFRDDLHTPSGRLLVTTLIHEEAEIADGIITRNDILVSNSSCYIKTSGNEHCVYKLHQIGTITINNFIGDNNIGSHVFYGGDKEELRKKLVINNLLVKNGKTLKCLPMCQVNNAFYSNFDTSNDVLFYTSYFGSLTVENIRKITSAIATQTAGTVETLTISDIAYCTDAVYGLIRGDLIANEINLNNVSSNQVKLIECVFNSLKINGLKAHVDDDIFNNLILNRSVSHSIAEISNSTISCSRLFSGTAASYFYSSVSKETADNLRLNNTTLVNCCANDNVVPKYANCRIEMTAGLPYYFNYDPPSLATNTTQLKTVPLRGAKIGDAVAVAFDKPLQGTRIWGEVTAPDTITIYHRNDTGVTVDVANGTFTIKIV